MRGVAVINEDVDDDVFGDDDDLALYFTVYADRGSTDADGVYRWNGPGLTDAVQVVAAPHPGDIVQDSKTGVIYVSFPWEQKIKTLTLGTDDATGASTGVLVDFAGEGTAGAKDGPAAEATFNWPWALASDGKRGLLYVADIHGDSVRSIALSGDNEVSTVLNEGLRAPGGLAVDTSGDVYVSDTLGNEVQKINVGLLGATAVTVVAGDGDACESAVLPCGDGGDATKAQLHYPMGLAVQKNQLLIADMLDNRIRVVSLGAHAEGGSKTTINAYAGNGQEGLVAGPALDATMLWPFDVIFFDGDFDDDDDVALSGRKKVAGSLFSDSGNKAVRDVDDDDDDLVGGLGNPVSRDSQPDAPPWPPE